MKLHFLVVLLSIIIFILPGCDRNCKIVPDREFVNGDKTPPIINWTVKILDNNNNQVGDISTSSLEPNYLFSNGVKAVVLAVASDKGTGIKEYKYRFTDCEDALQQTQDFKIVSNLPDSKKNIFCELRLNLEQKFCRAHSFDLELIATDYSNNSKTDRLLILQ